MFGDLFGNMEEKQAELRQKLSGMTVEVEVGDGAVRVEANCNRQITNIGIDPGKIGEDMEQLEDLLLVAINRVFGARRSQGRRGNGKSAQRNASSRNGRYRRPFRVK